MNSCGFPESTLKSLCKQEVINLIISAASSLHSTNSRPFPEGQSTRWSKQSQSRTSQPNGGGWVLAKFVHNIWFVCAAPGTRFKSACGLWNYFQYTWPVSLVGKSNFEIVCAQLRLSLHKLEKKGDVIFWPLQFHAGVTWPTTKDLFFAYTAVTQQGSKMA